MVNKISKINIVILTKSIYLHLSCARAIATKRITQTRFLIADLEVISSESLIRTETIEPFFNMYSKRGTRCASSHEPNDKKLLITNAHTLYIRIISSFLPWNHVVLSFKDRIIDANVDRLSMIFITNPLQIYTLRQSFKIDENSMIL